MPKENIVFAIISNYGCRILNISVNHIRKIFNDLTSRNIDKFTTVEILQSKENAHKWAREKQKLLDESLDFISSEDYDQRHHEIKNKLTDRLVLLDTVLSKRQRKKRLLFTGMISVLTLTIWLQPWESPSNKLGDEWVNCNRKYNGQCSYIGNQFKTNDVEMYISEFFHNKNYEKDCIRAAGRRRC